MSAKCREKFTHLLGTFQKKSCLQWTWQFYPAVKATNNRSTMIGRSSHLRGGRGEADPEAVGFGHTAGTRTNSRDQIYTLQSMKLCSLNIVVSLDHPSCKPLGLITSLLGWFMVQSLPV